MAKHEFGIMDTAPVMGKRYDTYEPQKYDCISVEDDAVLAILELLQEIDFGWHTIDISEKGLTYYGVTLVVAAQNAAKTSDCTKQVCHSFWHIHS